MQTALHRRFLNVTFVMASVLCALAALVPLFLILGRLIYDGASHLSWAFFTEMPVPVGEAGGGMANAIVGSLMLVGIAMAVGIPLGIGGGIWLAEYGRGRRGFWLRYLTDLLAGTPSIVIGTFVYVLWVVPTQHFSAWAGGVALGLLMIPTITRTTEEMLKLVPLDLREASLALGISEWRTIVSVVLAAGRSGIITGILLAIARVAGETAPLLFTALGNRFWNVDLSQPTAALPLQIFTYAISPYEEWQAQAWAGALTLIAVVLVLNVVARLPKRA